MTADPIADARREGRTTLTEAESKALLAEVGIDTPEGREVPDADAAVEAAADIGYPVVVKVASPAVSHKSEWGNGAGVAVGLDGPDAVRDAAGRVLAAAGREGIDARVYVEAAADTAAGTEVIVGGLRDPSFGPTVLVGLGGVFTEVYGDVAHRLAPLSPAEARDALAELRAMRLLEGYRDRPAADVGALAGAVAAAGDLLAGHEGIAELDLNPVLATAGGVRALDALVVLTDQPGD